MSQSGQATNDVSMLTGERACSHSWITRLGLLVKLSVMHDKTLSYGIMGLLINISSVLSAGEL